MSISATEVNKLRTMTGAGMMDCKKALTEANGDFEAAIDILRKKGQKVSAARADNATSEGTILTNISKDGATGTLLAFACETEPVSKTDLFKDLAKSIFNVALEKQATSVEDINKLALADGRKVEEHVIDLTGKIGEKIVIASYQKVSAEKVVDYVHSNGKLAVLVAFKGTNGVDVAEVGKDVAMQIAAMKPVAVDKDNVDAKTIEREIEIGKEQARAEGKPENMLEKIAQGKLNKFYKDSTLLNQEFVKDNSKTIRQVLEDVTKGLTVTEFKRVSLS